MPLLLLLFIFCGLCAQNEKHQFRFHGKEFLLDGKPLQIISGEMHPARIPREYWLHRIRMTKAMGCNTIAVYDFWNYHETTAGHFDFTTGNHNVAGFIRLCHQEGMWVLLRPGPYVCAEWDFGGLPGYLLKIPDIKLRCRDSRYMTAVKRYIQHLSKEIVPLQCINGGPILMVQVENEYGSYGNDQGYMEDLKKSWVSNGIRIPFYTADGPTPYMLEAGNVGGAAIGINGGSDDKDFAQAEKQNPEVPVLATEVYPGWLTHWGEQWAGRDTGSLKKEVTGLLENHRSFNLYVVHGGTNFGFTAGANAFSPTQYQPDLTSYDYDAPISEQGLPTAKYYMLRRLIQQYVFYKLPDVPAPVKIIEIAPIDMKRTHNLRNERAIFTPSAQPKPMEAYGQNQGLILYKTHLIGHKSGKLKIWEPHDYALVFLNGRFIDTVERNGGKWEVDLPETNVKDPELEILVEGMGHINFAQFMIDRKGITDRVTLNGMTLMNWQTALFPMNEAFLRTHIPDMSIKVPQDKPCNFFTGRFSLPETGDVYFDMSGYSKGMVYVNGHNLGRYWNRGPQQRLYCPASWLKRGINSITVFDLHRTEPVPIKGLRGLL